MSQNLENLYIHDGMFIFADKEVFLEEFDLDFYGSKCLPYITESMDIDTQNDLEYARWLMRQS